MGTIKSIRITSYTRVTNFVSGCLCGATELALEHWAAGIDL